MNRILQELWRHSRIGVHHSKTRIWNRGGVCPAGCEELEVAARIVDPHAKVWRGSHEADLEQQGITVLGTPVGRPEFVERELQKVIASHTQFLQRIPGVKDLQCAWLLLLYCELPEQRSTSGQSALI